jgi:hypothetical protein
MEWTGRSGTEVLRERGLWWVHTVDVRGGCVERRCAEDVWGRLQPFAVGYMGRTVVITVLRAKKKVNTFFKT